MLAPTMATKKPSKKNKTSSNVRATSVKKSPKVAAKKKPKTVAKKASPAKKPAAKKVAKKPVAKTATKKPAVRAAAKKPATKPAAKTPVAKKPAKTAAVRRRDGSGHLDPQYAATLRAKSKEGQVRDRDDAFIGRKGHTSDALAEELGETWVATATSGEDENEETFNQDVPEDAGGPFVTTTAGQEFAEGTDASNPKRSKREPFPRT